MASGIYKILNTANGKFYIGSSCNLKKREQSHFAGLKRGDHDNTYLQNAYNIDKENFKFLIVEECPKELLIEREQYYLDETKCYLRDIGYNIRLIAEKNIGIKKTEEQRKNMSGENNHLSKFTNSQVREIRRLFKEGVSCEEIAQKFDAKAKSLSPIVQNRSYVDENYIYEPRLGSTGRSGEKSNYHKLNWEQVRDIRSMYQNGSSFEEIEKKHGITQGTIQPIITNKTWKDESYEYVNNGYRKIAVSGENNAFSKYTLEQVNLMREKYENENWSTQKIEDVYGFSRGAVKSIVTYRTWNLDGREIYHKEQEKISSLLKVAHSGENNPVSKLTLKQVKKIRHLYAESPTSIVKLAKMFAVSEATIGYILKNKLWHDPNYVYINKRERFGEYVSKKLNEEQQAQIRELYTTGNTSYSKLAAQFGVSLGTIANTVKKTYKETK